MTHHEARDAASDHFAGNTVALDVLHLVRQAVGRWGLVKERVGVSQVSFRRQRGFAYLWNPGRYVVSDVPVVLSLCLGRQLDSPRFKSIVHPAAGTFMHHLEIRQSSDVDAEVVSWLREAWAEAGPRRPPPA